MNSGVLVVPQEPLGIPTPSGNGSENPVMAILIGSTTVTVAFVGVQPDVVRACVSGAMTAWAACTPVLVDEAIRPVDVRCVLGYVTTPHERECAVQTALNDLSREITRVLVDRLGHSHVLLHAAALPLPGGLRCGAVVGASGAGKTTFARAHEMIGYLTDELVAVDPFGTVVPYPKPFSIVTDGPVKEQRAPTVRTAGTWHLGALIVLDRREGIGEPTATRLDLAESLEALVPHSSRLSSLPRPLHRMTKLIADCGGVVRLRYSEAAHVDLAVLLAACERQPLGYTDPMFSGSDSRATDRSGTIVRDEDADAIEVGGRLMVLARDRLLRLSPFAAAVWRSCRTAATAQEIAVSVGADASAVRDIAGELADHGVLREHRTL